MSERVIEYGLMCDGMPFGEGVTFLRISTSREFAWRDEWICPLDATPHKHYLKQRECLVGDWQPVEVRDYPSPSTTQPKPEEESRG